MGKVGTGPGKKFGADQGTITARKSRGWDGALIRGTLWNRLGAFSLWNRLWVLTLSNRLKVLTLWNRHWTVVRG